MFGDFAYFLKVRYHIDMTLMQTSIFAILSQIVHYIDYKNNKTPHYLRPFLMMSGIITPYSIGFNNKKDIYKMIKITKSLTTFTVINQNVLFPCFFSCLRF